MGVLSRLAATDWTTFTGKAVRFPLRLVPHRSVVRVLSGPMKGLRWQVGASVHGCWLGTFELDEQRFLARAVKPGMVAWDLGANAGVYSLLLARLVGPNGAVYAFEPFPHNCAVLREHISLNGFDNVTVIAAAVSDEDGLLGFRASSSTSMGAVQASWGPLVVPTVSLDSMLSRHRLAHPDFIKIDVEGSESAVLRGAAQLLTARRTQWVVSLHGPEQAEVCEKVFRDSGYALSSIDGRKVGPSLRSSGVTDIVAVPCA